MESDQELDELAVGISERLDLVIDLDWQGRGHRLRDRDGGMFNLSRCWRDKERVRVTPYVPAWDARCGSDVSPHTTHVVDSLSITCAASRGAEAIAKDIQRRILPEYAPKLAEAKESVAADERDHLYREGLAAALRPLLQEATGTVDVRRYPHAERTREATWHWYRPDDGKGLGRGKVTVTRYGVNIEIDGMDPDLFMRMLEAAMPAEVHT